MATSHYAFALRHAIEMRQRQTDHLGDVLAADEGCLSAFPPSGSPARYMLCQSSGLGRKERIQKSAPTIASIGTSGTVMASINQSIPLSMPHSSLAVCLPSFGTVSEHFQLTIQVRS